MCKRLGYRSVDVGLAPTIRSVPKLLQTCSTEGFQVVLPFCIVLGWYLAGDPRQRDVGLDAAQFAERGFGSVALSGHGGRCRQDPGVVKPSAQAAGQGRFLLTRRPVPLLAPPITQYP
jgi:hypothetical protein